MDHVHAVVGVVGERAYVVARAQTSPFHHLDRLVAYDLVTSEARTLTVGLENTQFHTDGVRPPVLAPRSVRLLRRPAGRAPDRPR